MTARTDETLMFESLRDLIRFLAVAERGNILVAAESAASARPSSTATTKASA